MGKSTWICQFNKSLTTSDIDSIYVVPVLRVCQLLDFGHSGANEHWSQVKTMVESDHSLTCRIARLSSVFSTLANCAPVSVAHNSSR